MDRNGDTWIALDSSGGSLSARRAWIEISNDTMFKNTYSLLSLSARRAWIEIEVTRNSDTGTYRRSPQGERG